MADRPAPELQDIEITPAMIEAGLLPFFRFHREKDIAEEVVIEIYTAMVKVRHHIAGPDHKM